MDRLTFEGNFCDISRCQGEYRMTSKCADGPCSQRKVWERLKDYEDTGLEPDVCAEYKKFEDEVVSKGVTFKRIIELMEAEKDGRLVVLPFKVGDFVYLIAIKRQYVNHPMHTPYIKVVEIKPENAYKYINEIGKTVFLTRKEAEAALKGRGGDES